MNSICKKILVTSCKGGVGKSTFSAGLAIALALRGNRVLLCDLDFSNRSLDLMLGEEDRLLLDAGDVLLGRSPLSNAAIASDDFPGLFLLGAPFRDEGSLSAESLQGLLSQAENEKFNYLIIDTGGDFGAPVEQAAMVCEHAYLITDTTPIAIRAIAKSASYLAGIDGMDTALIVNGFDTRMKPGKDGEPTLLEVIDRASVRLDGIVPYDRLLREKGPVAVFGIGKNNTRLAFENIAARTEGENVPLLSGMRHVNRRRLLEH